MTGVFSISFFKDTRLRTPTWAIYFVVRTSFCKSISVVTDSSWFENKAFKFLTFKYLMRSVAQKSALGRIMMCPWVWLRTPLCTALRSCRTSRAEVMLLFKIGIVDFCLEPELSYYSFLFTWKLFRPPQQLPWHVTDRNRSVTKQGLLEREGVINFADMHRRK